MTGLKLTNVCVDFPVYNARGRSLKSSIFNATTGGRLASEPGSINVRALNNINLEIKANERVALLGHNGAGKSTLLRVMAGIYYPTHGEVVINGQVNTMFNANIGVSPEATGWQNIEARGIILGFSKSQINRLKEDVAEISGLGPFLDMPVRTYSAGMSMRLAFCVSTSVQPDILLLDEAIMAGDAGFIKMARKRLNTLIENSNILVLASHSQAVLKMFCNRGALLHHGELTFYENIDEMLTVYNEQVRQGK